MEGTITSDGDIILQNSLSYRQLLNFLPKGPAACKSARTKIDVQPFTKIYDLPLVLRLMLWVGE